MNLMIENDVAAFSRIEAVNMILETLQKLTGMRLSMIVRVDDESWTACSVANQSDFDMESGDQLVLSNTY